MIKVVLTSPRVAPGLLTRAGWQAFTEADEIGAAAGESGGGAAAGASPSVQALVGSGLPVTAIEGGPEAHLAWLTDQALAGRQVAWLVGEDGEPGLLRLIADHLSREPRPEYEIEILHGSYDVPGARLIDLVRVMDRLRRNCPWDQEQTHRSLARYLLEETYETLEAIDTGDRAHLREELGDLLLQVAFHSRIAEESIDGESADGADDGAGEGVPADDESIDRESTGEGFSIDDVAADIVEKLIRRHPHVFGTVAAADAAAVEANWETIKAAEKQRTSVLEGIPHALPALSLADKVLGRSAKVLADHPGAASTRPVEPAPKRPAEPPSRTAAGADEAATSAGAPAAAGSSARPAESSARPAESEIDADLASGSEAGARREHEIGERLLALVREAREAGVDPEQALRDATRRLATQIRAAESNPS